MAAEFHSELATERLSPVEVRLGPEGRTKSSSAPPRSQLQFTRLVGGRDRYCGTLSSGPIRCWGKVPALAPGNFTDVALGDEGYCGVELSGQLTCEKLSPPEGVFARVVASGKNYCAVSPGGAVQCFGPGAAPPQVNQRAEFVTVGDGFACASDPTARLVCWGPEAPLLPIDPFRVKDTAAGAHVLCYLTEDGSSHCLGKGPRLGDRRYAALNAGYETVCGITTASAGYCFGKVEVQTSGPVRQFAVAESSVCAHRQDGRIECWGDASESQLVVPTEARLATEKRGPGSSAPVQMAEASLQVDAALWLEFLELFPSKELPLTFDEREPISLGDRVPAKFEPLILRDPNLLRAGFGVALAHDIVGLTLFDLEKRALLLHLYRARRLISTHELLRWDQTAEPLKEAAGGSGVLRRAAKLLRSLVTTKDTIEVTLLDGKEVISYAKRVGDGTREVAQARCDIEKKTYVLRLLPTAETRKENEKVTRDYGATDRVGCGARLPFRSE